ncbi:MAG: hypothetical protein Q9160_003791 [Pyrenula sp. 1 TL-2023]
MAIRRFSVELLRMIFSDVDTKDYLAIALTCHQFAVVAAHLLYHTVEFEWAKAWDDENRKFYIPPYPQFNLFVRSLLENHTFAAHVKNLRFLGERPGSLDPNPTASVRGLSPASIHRAAALLGHEYRKSLCEGNVEAWIHVIFCLCTELRCLQLGHTFFHEDGFVWRDRWPPLLDLWSRSLPNLRRLETVDLGCDNGGDPDKPRNNSLIASVLRLNTLNTMRIKYRDSAPSFSMLFQDLVLPNLTTLDLYQCQLREAGLGQILCALPSLVNLSVYLLYDANPTDGRSPFVDCESLRSALENASQVRKLKLGIEFFCGTAMDVAGGGDYASDANWGFKGALGNLKTFTRLDLLEISPTILFGWRANHAARISQVIPDSVTTLTLSAELWDWDDYQWGPIAIEHLMKEDFERLIMTPAMDRAQGNPNLRSVTIHVCPFQDDYDQGMWDLRPLGYDAGVSVNIEEVGL